MWLGEKITDKGIGNGISLLIMVGIIATLPQAFIQEFASRVFESNGGLIMILIELVIWFLIILASVMLVMAVRQIRCSMPEEQHPVDTRRMYLVQDSIYLLN
jgi:preprotein translocase subunit SecY